MQLYNSLSHKKEEFVPNHPDIDTKVYFTSEEELTPGSYVPVLITDACEYDLIGTVPHKEETT